MTYKDPVKQKEYLKEYRQKKKAEHKEYFNNYYNQNKEKLNEQRRKNASLKRIKEREERGEVSRTDKLERIMYQLKDPEIKAELKNIIKSVMESEEDVV